MYQVGLFFKTKNEIKESFDEYEIDSIVKSLNYDVNNVNNGFPILSTEEENIEDVIEVYYIEDLVKISDFVNRNNL